MTKWPVNDVPIGLSVTPEPDFYVLVTFSEARKLKKFDTNGGPLQEVLLQQDVYHPRHAIQFGSNFVVSHGDWQDAVHRVCIVDSADRVKLSYGGRSGLATGQLNNPSHLAVDGKGNIFVADTNNERVLLLSGTFLSDVRELVSARISGAWRPRKIYFDETQGRLFVANKNVIAFQIKDI